ncbi:MAG: hypothetical protein GF311_12640 [Candidatus Lokiarchaeota archaeon]|nr:hypothetical protein [Candidatus Lokiarchaeota archaeon]
MRKTIPPEHIRFAHISDCHIGGWRKESLNQLGYEAFTKAIDIIIEEELDFVIISGDLYDVSNPKVDAVDLATAQFKRLSDNKIPVYGIMGSHDYSPSDRSMIRPLKSAGLYTDLYIPTPLKEDKLQLEFVVDPDTEIKLTGIRARKRSLEIKDYEKLEKLALEKEPGRKIFVLHTMIEELKPKIHAMMKAGPQSLLPRGFLYYAGGHLHMTHPTELRIRDSITIQKDDPLPERIVYPGCLFPTRFNELEEFKVGGFCICDLDTNSEDLTVTFTPLQIKEIEKITIQADNKSIQQLKTGLEQELKRREIDDKIVIIRIEGELASGKSYELRPAELIADLKKKGAYEVLINKAKLRSHQTTKIEDDDLDTIEEIETRYIYKHSQNIEIEGIKAEDLEQKIHTIISELGQGLQSGQKKKDYKAAMINSFYKIMNISLKTSEEHED